MVAALKLAYFVVERAAEPLSARLEVAAANSDLFRRACGQLANWSNSLEHRKQQRRLARERTARGHTRVDGWEDADELQSEPKLSEEQATELGCQLMGEGFVISVGLALLLHQVGVTLCSCCLLITLHGVVIAAGSWYVPPIYCCHVLAGSTGA